VRKWINAKKKEEARYERHVCFMARDVSEKYQSLENLELAQSL
jgi:hypothetical protein